MYKLILYRYIQITLISKVIVMTMSSLQGQHCHPNLQFYSGENTIQSAKRNEILKQPENLKSVNGINKHFNEIRDGINDSNNFKDDIKNELKVSLTRKLIPNVGFWPFATVSSFKDYLYHGLYNINEHYKSPHKKTSNAFYGVRGKKLITIPPSPSSLLSSSLRTILLDNNVHPSSSNDALLSSINDLRDLMRVELVKIPLSSSSILLRISNNDSHKRTPIGFMGLRGKRDSSYNKTGNIHSSDDQDSRIFALKNRIFLMTPDEAVLADEQMDESKRKYAEFWKESILHDLKRRSSSFLPSSAVANIMGKQFVAVRGKKHNEIFPKNYFFNKG